MAKKYFAIDQDSRSTVDDSYRYSGIGIGNNKGIYYKWMNELLYQSGGIDHVLGSASQLSSGACTIAWSNTNSRFEDKDGTQVTFSDYDRIDIIGSDTLTTNMNLGAAKGLKIKSINGAELQLGDSGSGVPYKIIHAPSTTTTAYDHSEIDILTDKQFEDFTFAYTSDQRRYYAYQGMGGRVRINGHDCYNGLSAGEIVAYDTMPVNPYLVRMDGRAEHWELSVGNNDTLAFFTMLNRKSGGWRDGAMTQSRFTLASLISSYAYKFNVNAINRGLYDMNTNDFDRHSREDAQGISHSATATFVSGSNVVTFDAIGNIKEGMRINGAGGYSITEGSSGTTIILNISGNTAEMYDAEYYAIGQLVPVNSSTTDATGISVTLDNSGMAGGSSQDFTSQRMLGSAGVGNNYGIVGITSGVFQQGGATESGTQGLDYQSAHYLYYDNNGGGLYNASGDGSGDGQNTSANTAGFYFQKG